MLDEFVHRLPADPAREHAALEPLTAREREVLAHPIGLAR
jgi:hypothetical protein